MLARIKQSTPLGLRRALRRVAGPAAPMRHAVRTDPVDPTIALAAQIAYNEHGGYCVPANSVARPSAQRILRGEVWEPETLALIARHAGRGDVVHAGTYFGDFLPVLSRSVAPTGRVWAFEPNPENHRCAQITVLLNGLDNVELRRAGLGAAAATGQLLVEDSAGEALGGGSRLTRDGGTGATGGTTTETPIVSIDEAVPADRPVAVIQLDVEGFEDDALRGARETLTRCRPLVIVERRPGADVLEELLHPLGYRATGRVHYNTVLEPGDPSDSPPHPLPPEG